MKQAVPSDPVSRKVYAQATKPDPKIGISGGTESQTPKHATRVACVRLRSHTAEDAEMASKALPISGGPEFVIDRCCAEIFDCACQVRSDRPMLDRLVTSTRSIPPHGSTSSARLSISGRLSISSCSHALD